MKLSYNFGWYFSKLLRTFTFLFTSILFITITTACSGAAASAPQQPSLAQGLPASISAAQELPKQKQVSGAQPTQAAEWNESLSGTSGMSELAAQSGAAQPGALAAPAPAEGSAPQAKAVVDLSIPAEPQIGFRAPDFTLQTLDGVAIRLSDLAGRPVLINYWATWCVPCQKELPLLQTLYQEYQGKGLVIITINAIEQDSVEKVQAMVAEKGMTYPVLLDKGDQFAKAYQAIFFPTTFFVDASGVIQHITLGDSSEADLRARIESLLANGF